MVWGVDDLVLPELGVDDDLDGLIIAFIATAAFAAKLPFDFPLEVVPPRLGVEFLEVLELIEEREGCRLIVLATLGLLRLGVAAWREPINVVLLASSLLLLRVRDDLADLTNVFATPVLPAPLRVADFSVLLALPPVVLRPRPGVDFLEVLELVEECEVCRLGVLAPLTPWDVVTLRELGGVRLPVALFLPLPVMCPFIFAFMAA